MNDKDLVSTAPPGRPENVAWKEIVARYQKPSVGRGVWQIVNTLVPYAALWYLMYVSLSVSYWLVVPLGILAAGVRDAAASMGVDDHVVVRGRASNLVFATLDADGQPSQ